MILTSKKARKCRRKKRERNDKVSRQLSDIARKLSFFHPHSEHCAINGNVLSHRYTFSLVLLPSIFNCNENINELKTIRMIPLTLYILWKKSDQSKKLSIWIKITVTSLTFIWKKSENQVNFTWTGILNQIQHVKPCFNVGEHPLINILFLMSKDKGIWNRNKMWIFFLEMFKLRIYFQTELFSFREYLVREKKKRHRIHWIFSHGMNVSEMRAMRLHASTRSFPAKDNFSSAKYSLSKAFEMPYCSSY